MDAYKSGARDEIMSWMTYLRKCGVSQDWMVVLVENADSSRSSKTSKLLTRTSVLDKLKTEIGGKQPERCCSLVGECMSKSVFMLSSDFIIVLLLIVMI